ncbi:DUF4235 domain-containing protein [Streptomyces erythrochromogenes]|uniref:DUF4235 domain-containing protein n=1 Tax=Streptomyces erythrochromogenes TaxID=285574 RepID=A0ABZ1Q5R5_9ACTN|nr:DUF4235 domain-containing protein [Streptomyces erythrochromogenes]MCX5583351.1 DUF4235 domain-containing protein [Streptomyces erythrochromogenes]
MKASTVAYKPVGMTLGALGGVLAGIAFKQVWKRLGHEDDAPNATDQDRSWREILIAAILQGAVFAAVKAAIDRGGAVAVRRLTGTWPD